MMTPILPALIDAFPFDWTKWVELGISGVVLVAIGVGLYLTMMYFKAHNKEIDQRNEDISKREEALAKEAQETRQFLQQMLTNMQDVMKKNQAHVYDEKEEKESSNFQIFLTKELKFIQDQIGASRTFFCMYHNGAHSLNNINFYKFSVIDEIWNPDLNPIHREVQNYPAPVYRYFKNLLLENKKGLLIKNIEEVKEDTATYMFFDSRGAKSVLAQGVYDESTNILLGFLIAEFNDWHENWTDTDWKNKKITVSRGADKISGVMIASSADDEIRREKTEGGARNDE